MNYRDILVTRAASMLDEHAPLSPTQFRNKRALREWRQRWAEYHRNLKREQKA